MRSCLLNFLILKKGYLNFRNLKLPPGFFPNFKFLIHLFPAMSSYGNSQVSCNFLPALPSISEYCKSVKGLPISTLRNINILIVRSGRTLSLSFSQTAVSRKKLITPISNSLKNSYIQHFE